MSNEPKVVIAASTRIVKHAGRELYSEGERYTSHEAADILNQLVTRLEDKLEAAENELEASKRCAVEQALGGGFFKCDRPVSPEGNGSYCEFHGAQTAGDFDVELTQCGKALKRAKIELEAVRKACLATILTPGGDPAIDQFAREILRAMEEA